MFLYGKHVIFILLRSVPLLREVPEETLAKIADVLEEVCIWNDFFVVILVI